jgi:hypothetical protein
MEIKIVENEKLENNSLNLEKISCSKLYHQHETQAVKGG